MYREERQDPGGRTRNSNHNYKYIVVQVEGQFHSTGNNY